MRSASTSSPMPSTSTTRASSYFCAVLEHKVTWKEKGGELPFWKSSSPSAEGRKEPGDNHTDEWGFWVLYDGTRRFTFLVEQATYQGRGMLSFFKGQVRSPKALAQQSCSFLRMLSKKPYASIRGKMALKDEHYQTNLNYCNLNHSLHLWAT